VGLEPGTSRSL